MSIKHWSVVEDKENFSRHWDGDNPTREYFSMPANKTLSTILTVTCVVLACLIVLLLISRL